jgi:GxxExxY protein
LGCGFLERIYENALEIELRNRGIKAKRQVPFAVHYQGQVIGNFVADYVVEGKLVLELKALTRLNSSAEAQLLNYLKASGLSVGLLLNFGKTKLQIKRMVQNFVEGRPV